MKQENILLLTKTTGARFSQEAIMTMQPLFVNEYKVKVAVVFTKKQVFWISPNKT